MPSRERAALLKKAEQAYVPYDHVRTGKVDKLGLCLVLADLAAFGEHSNMELSDHFETVFRELAPRDHMVPLEMFPELMNAVRGFSPNTTIPGIVPVPLYYHVSPCFSHALISSISSNTRGSRIEGIGDFPSSLGLFTTFASRPRHP